MVTGTSSLSNYQDLKVEHTLFYILQLLSKYFTNSLNVSQALYMRQKHYKCVKSSLNASEAL